MMSEHLPSAVWEIMLGKATARATERSAMGEAASTLSGVCNVG